jgi:hypothetical protein
MRPEKAHSLHDLAGKRESTASVAAVPPIKQQWLIEKHRGSARKIGARSYPDVVKERRFLWKWKYSFQ